MEERALSLDCSRASMTAAVLNGSWKTLASRVDDVTLTSKATPTSNPPLMKALARQEETGEETWHFISRVACGMLRNHIRRGGCARDYHTPGYNRRGDVSSSSLESSHDDERKSPNGTRVGRPKQSLLHLPRYLKLRSSFILSSTMTETGDSQIVNIGI